MAAMYGLLLVSSMLAPTQWTLPTVAFAGAVTVTMCSNGLSDSGS